MSTLVSTQSIIWEECINHELCVKVFGKKYCVRIQGCVRVVKDGGAIYIEVEALGRKWRYNLTNACHTVFTVGIATFRLCIEATGGNGVRIVVQGCLGVAGLKKCWTLLGKDIRWLAASALAADDLAALGLAHGEASLLNAARDEFFIVLESDLEEAERSKITLQKDS